MIDGDVGENKLNMQEQGMSKSPTLELLGESTGQETAQQHFGNSSTVNLYTK